MQGRTRHLAAFVLALAACGAARAGDNLECSGLFGGDTSHAALVKAFGEANVVYKAIDRPQGSTGHATILFERNPERRLIVEWRDEAARAKPIYFGVNNPSQWIGPLGVKIGTGIEEAEKLNGKVFRLNGFGWDLGGNAQFDRKDGKFGNLPGGCQFGFTFEPAAEGLPLGGKYRSLNGNRDLYSNNKLLREVKPVIVEMLIIYPENH
jgi:hypothetical protein